MKGIPAAHGEMLHRRSSRKRAYIFAWPEIAGGRARLLSSSLTHLLLIIKLNIKRNEAFPSRQSSVIKLFPIEEEKMAVIHALPVDASKSAPGDDEKW